MKMGEDRCYYDLKYYCTEDNKDCENFKQALALHCHQTTRIVKEFSGCWPSATEFKEGITVDNVKTKFIPVAFKKIISELKQREGVNA